MITERWPDARLKSFRYRLTSFGEGRAEWRSSHDDAMRDAVQLGLASWDREKREHYLAVPVAIEREAVPIGPIPPLSVRGKARTWSTEDEGMLGELARRGTPIEEMGRQLGRTRQSVQARLRLLGLVQLRQPR